MKATDALWGEICSLGDSALWFSTCSGVTERHAVRQKSLSQVVTSHPVILGTEVLCLMSNSILIFNYILCITINIYMWSENKNDTRPRALWIIQRNAGEWSQADCLLARCAVFRSAITVSHPDFTSLHSSLPSHLRCSDFKLDHNLSPIISLLKSVCILTDCQLLRRGSG